MEEREEERDMATGDVSMFDEITIRAQRAARSENQRLFKKILEEHKERLLESFDLFGNTAIHIAIRSNNPHLLRELLEMLPQEGKWHALRKGNCVNKTLLHEMIFCTIVKMTDVVFKFEKQVKAPPNVHEEKKRLPPVLINDSGVVIPSHCKPF